MPKKTTTKKTTATRKTAPRASRGTRPGGPPPGTAWLATYLPREIFEAMRDAYMWELDHTPDPDTSLARWIGSAVIEHCRRTPQERAALDAARPPAQVKGRAGHESRPFAVAHEAHDALTAAELADRAALLAGSKAETVTTAIWARVDAIRSAAGGTLPHYTGRLPSKPTPAANA